MISGHVTRLLLFAAGMTVYGHAAGFSKCDLNLDSTVDVADAQKGVSEALGQAQANDDLNLDSAVNVLDVQIVINAALGFGCVADPAIQSIVPNTLQQGTVGASVTIKGSRTSFTNSSAVSLGPSITVSNIAAPDAVTLTATISVSADAAPGPRTLTVDDLTLANALSVIIPGTVSYSYDSQGRLSRTTYTAPSGTVTVVTYSYDAAGNRTAVVAQ